MKTLQQTFDYAVDKIVGQGCRCMDKSESEGKLGCLYGDDEGNHCAIGWLLDHDNEELMSFRGGLGNLADEHPEYLPDIVTKNEKLFGWLQMFHDAPDSTNRWIRADEIQRFGINISNPNVQKWIDMGN